MTSSRLVRGAKTRMFAFICLVFVLGALVYIFHGTQTRLSEVQQQAGICSQQLEALNAQMQVILEYKLRLTGTLNKEKESHRQTREELEKRFKDEKDKWDKESLEIKNKYDALIQKNNMLQSQLEDTKEKIGEIEDERRKIAEDSRKEVDSIKKEKEMAEQKLKDELRQKEEEIESLNRKELGAAQSDDQKCVELKKRNEELERYNVDMKKHLSDCQMKLPPVAAAASSSPKTEAKNVGAQPDTNFGEMPRMGNGLSKMLTSTPGINPQAVGGDLSSVKPLLEADAVQRKLDEQIKLPSKKPTQESVVPLVQPGKFEQVQGVAQIPGPPDQRTNTLHKPKTNEVNEEMNNIIAEEPEDPLMHDQQEKGQLRGPYLPLNSIHADAEPVVGQQAQVALDREEEEEGGGEVNVRNQLK